MPTTGSLIDNPYKLGTKPEKASVRGAIRIIQRKQKKLLADEKIGHEVLHWDWSRYDRDGAGRYYIDPDDRKALDLHIRKA
jgi:hypothetical protein